VGRDFALFRGRGDFRRFQEAADPRRVQRKAAFARYGFQSEQAFGRGGPLGHALDHHGFRKLGKARQQARVQEGRLGRILLQDGQEDRMRGLPVEREAAGQAPIEEDPGGEHIGAIAGDQALRLFRSRIARRAQVGSGLGDGELLLDEGHAEVGDADAAAPIDQDIGGLDVAMDDARLMRGAEAPEELVEDGKRDQVRHPARGLLEHVVQGRSVHVFHRQEMDLAFLSEIEDADHIFMRQRRDGHRLLLETQQGLGRIEQVRVQLLEGYLAMEDGILGQEYRSRGPGGDLPDNGITALILHFGFHAFSTLGQRS